MNRQLSIKAPGRINLIGGHIDYSGGYVLPAAIQRHLQLDFERTENKIVTVFSEQMDDEVQFELASDTCPKGWKSIVYGVVQTILEQQPGAITGFHCTISGNLPMGSGLSSSAALTCGLVYGLNKLFDIGLETLSLVLLAQQVERVYLHTQCGIMDPFIIMEALANQFALLDCETIFAKPIPADLGDYSIVLFNTNIHHNNASTEYNARRATSERIFEKIKRKHPGYTCLAKVPLRVLQHMKEDFSEQDYKKGKFVIEENQRVLDTVLALRKKALEQVGELLFQSHWGLSRDYQVSCPELDFLVELAEQHHDILGARMMGGGFGGCTINLMKTSTMDQCIQWVANKYNEWADKEMTPIKVSIGAGITTVNLKRPH